MQWLRSVETEFFRMLNRLVEPHIRAGYASPRLVPGGLVVLEVRGRRSGRRSRVPVVATRIQGHLVVGTFRGERSQWVRNLAATPEARVWIGGRARHMTAIVISAARRPCPGRELPPLLRWIVTALRPYTHAGWAFALLAPAPPTPAAARRTRPRRTSLNPRTR